MPLQAVVRKDFHDSIRSFSLLFTTLLFVAFATFQAAIRWIPVPYRDTEVATSTMVLLNSMRQPAVFFVPLIALVLSYDTLVGERESGSLRLLIGLPNSRRAAVFGKVIGRTAVLGVALLVGYGVAAAIVLATYRTLALDVFLLYTLATVLYGGVYVSLATGFSAAMESRMDAFAGAGVLYMLFLIGWDFLLLLLEGVVYPNGIPEDGLPDWFMFLGMFNPSTAFMKATRVVIPEYREMTFYPTGEAVYVHDWVGFPILLLWAAVPLAIGYWRFERTDID